MGPLASCSDISRKKAHDVARMPMKFSGSPDIIHHGGAIPAGEKRRFYLQGRVFQCALGLGPEARGVSLQRSPEKACRSKGRPVPLPWEVHRRAQP